MPDQEQDIGISAPSLPKGGGAIQSIGKGWGAIGATGTASLSIPLPITAGRGYAPALGLVYQSSVGNGLFGLGWSLNLGCVARKSSKGVPSYTDDDDISGPDGGVWLASRGDDGAVISQRISNYGGLALDKTYDVIRYHARTEGAFDLIEHWRHGDDPQGFWLIHGADGTLAVYGRNRVSRRADPADPNRVAEWLLDESMNSHGEHILYEYKAEDEQGASDVRFPIGARDFKAQRYLWRVRYGNFSAHPNLYGWEPDQLATLEWHFDLIFDYGERDDTRNRLAYEEDRVWEARADYHASFAYGFELGNLRFVHHVIMFHHFPAELENGPTLISALTLRYQDLAQGYKGLSSVQSVSWTPDHHHFMQQRPPVAFNYQDFDADAGGFSAFEAMPGLDNGERYQWVDLYADGMPGVLCKTDKGWMYRAPLRDDESCDPDAVTYRNVTPVDSLPVADSQAGPRQFLADLTGDGRLDWIVAKPGTAGFFTLQADRSWSAFEPFAAFPAEFFNPLAQLTDLVGAGLSDLALIGPRSVRLYASQRARGFAPASEVAHDEADRLPLLSDSQTELVAFCDILGSGQAHLVRIRHDEIRVWPNMGRGRFGSGYRFARLPFSYDEFDARCVRLADMDGAGAVDVVYLHADGFALFMNASGHSLAEPVFRSWPEGVRFDPLCQVSLVDLQGLGCSSLVLSVPHQGPDLKPAHWRFDYPAIKPYLLNETTQ